MDLKEIEALIRLFEKSEISVLKIEEGDKKIKLEKNLQPVSNVIQMSGNAAVPAVYTGNLPQSAGALSSAESSAESKGSAEEKAAAARSASASPKGREVKSPMVGVFYAAPSPDDPPYVCVGDKVKKGDVLCIVEAMKLMNEILSEMDGEVLEVCMENGDIVEYGQTMFRIG